MLFMVVNLLYYFAVQKLDSNFSKCIEASEFRNRQFRCIVIGNSLAMDGVDAGLFLEKGISTYNLSIGGASLKANYLQLKSYLEKNQLPEWVILGLSSCFGDDFNSEIINPVIDHCYHLSGYSISDLPLWKFRWIAKELLKKLISKDHREVDLQYGQLKFKRVVADKSDYNKNAPVTLDSLKYMGSDYLMKIDSLCNQYKIKLIAIEMPGLKNTQNGIPVLNTLNFGKDRKSFQLINLNNREFCRLFDDKKDWLGNCHLNESGAQKLSNSIYEMCLKNDISL